VTQGVTAEVRTLNAQMRRNFAQRSTRAAKRGVGAITFDGSIRVSAVVAHRRHLAHHLLD
jgi:hypothetical protein